MSADPTPHHEAFDDVLDAMREDLADWQRWLARFIVLAHAAAAGLAVVGFTWLCDRALATFSVAWHHAAWFPLLWTPLCCAAIVWVTRRFAPAAAGSGIPQVMAGLSAQVDARRLKQLVSLPMSAVKVALTSTGLLCGLAIGREGPSVQIAAGILASANRWLPRQLRLSSNSLLVAGGAAGIAAAFNAPLAGVMFAIEELARSLDQRSSGLTVSAIVLSGVVAISVYGNVAYFGVIHAPPLSWGFLGPALLATMAAGLLGGLFSRLLQASLISPPRDRFSRFRAANPVRFAAACGLAIAVIGLVTGGATYGSGYGPTRRLVEGSTSLPLLYVTLRFAVTWLAAWAGVPGGLFAPTLALGAGVGADIALMTHSQGIAPGLIALGMAAFLAAVTQAPLTAFIIVMEMVDGHAMVLTLMTAALGGSLIARWLSRPLYPALAEFQLVKMGLQPEDLHGHGHGHGHGHEHAHGPAGPTPSTMPPAPPAPADATVPPPAPPAPPAPASAAAPAPAPTPAPAPETPGTPDALPPTTPAA